MAVKSACRSSSTAWHDVVIFDALSHGASCARHRRHPGRAAGGSACRPVAWCSRRRRRGDGLAGRARLRPAYGARPLRRLVQKAIGDERWLPSARRRCPRRRPRAGPRLRVEGGGRWRSPASPATRKAMRGCGQGGCFATADRRLGDADRRAGWKHPARFLASSRPHPRPTSPSPSSPGSLSSRSAQCTPACRSPAPSTRHFIELSQPATGTELITWSSGR